MKDDDFKGCIIKRMSKVSDNAGTSDSAIWTRPLHYSVDHSHFHENSKSIQNQNNTNLQATDTKTDADVSRNDFNTACLDIQKSKDYKLPDNTDSDSAKNNKVPNENTTPQPTLQLYGEEMPKQKAPLPPIASKLGLNNSNSDQIDAIADSSIGSNDKQPPYKSILNDYVIRSTLPALGGRSINFHTLTYNQVLYMSRTPRTRTQLKRCSRDQLRKFVQGLY